MFGQWGRTNWACLDCQHVGSPDNAAPTCPRCRKPMTHMGINFKPPRKGRKSQWEKVRRLSAAGLLSYRRCSCHPTYPGIDHPVKTLSDAKSQLHQRRSDRKPPSEPDKVPKRPYFGYRAVRGPR